jgi:two-component system, sensor histidine kinase and response regulator
MPNTPRHILIADDERHSLILLQHILERDYQVTGVEDGREALQVLRQGVFDLVVTDINMPFIDGFGLLKAIRETPELAHLPVILISGLSDSEDIARGLKMGANDYLTKPVDTQITLARVGSQLQLKELVDAHKEAISELQAIQKMRDRFFRIASHDLKNPMNNIRMAQFLLRSNVGDNAESIKLLDNIEIALDTMQEIVRDFLETAALQSEAIDLELDRVEVDELLWEVLMQFNIAATKKDIQMDVQDSGLSVVGDRKRLSQIFSNLLSNAVKFSPHGRKVLLWAESRGDVVRVNVRDWGPGIPEDEREMLFREFSRLTPRPTGGENSTGLGLWIVKQLAVLQNGSVGADFPQEGGSIFWIDIPTWSESFSELRELSRHHPGT